MFRAELLGRKLERLALRPPSRGFPRRELPSGLFACPPTPDPPSMAMKELLLACGSTWRGGATTLGMGSADGSFCSVRWSWWHSTGVLLSSMANSDLMVDAGVLVVLLGLAACSLDAYLVPMARVETWFEARPANRQVRLQNVVLRRDERRVKRDSGHESIRRSRRTPRPSYGAVSGDVDGLTSGQCNASHDHASRAACVGSNQASPLAS
jgi:hypothetical protein